MKELKKFWRERDKKYKKKRNYNDILKSDKNYSLEKLIPEKIISKRNFKLPKIDYKYTIKEEYKINNLKGYNQFHIPESVDVYNSLYNASINDYVNQFININDKIKFNIFKQIQIYADGNCYYRALSKFMTDKEIYHPFYRNTIYNYIIDNKKNFLDQDSYVDYLEHNINSVININEYIEKINTLDFYEGEVEIAATSKLFKINIYIFELNKDNEYKFLYKHMHNENLLTYTMILQHLYTKSNQEHFQLLYINNNILNNTNISKNSPNFKNENNSKEHHKNLNNERLNNPNSLITKKISENNVSLNVEKNSDNSKLNIVKAQLIENINDKFKNIFTDIVNTFYNYFNMPTLNQDNNIIETEHNMNINPNENMDNSKINNNNICDDIIDNHKYNNNINTNKCDITENLNEIKINEFEKEFDVIRNIYNDNELANEAKILNFILFNF